MFICLFGKLSLRGKKGHPPSEQLSLFHSIPLSKIELYSNEEKISPRVVRQLEKLPVALYKGPNKFTALVVNKPLSRS